MTEEIQLTDADVLLPVTVLQAGHIECSYEDGKLRYLRCGKHLLLQMIYAAVRDEHWGTLPMTIINQQVQQNANGFLITYTAEYGYKDPVYRAWFTLEGNKDNSVSMAMKGEALQPFKKNRIGICILHPVNECMGQMVRISTATGQHYNAGFPVLISPEPPFKDIQQMQWSSGGWLVDLSMTGDIFETEDQRNWSDNSYKTYSTPSSLPKPVLLKTGDEMAQQVVLRVTKDETAEPQPAAPKQEERFAFPPIGYNRAKNPLPLDAEPIPLLKKLPLHHYRFQLMLDDIEWPALLNAALEEAAMLNTKLALVIVMPPLTQTNLIPLLQILRERSSLLQSLLLLEKGRTVTNPQTLENVYALIKQYCPLLSLGYGTEGSFADLNHERPAGKRFDFISFALHPQVHATDNRSILDNAESHSHLLATARNFADGKPVFVSVTFKEVSHLHDPRQYSGLVAWFTLISLQQLAGADGITFYDLLGNNGLINVATAAETDADISRSATYEMLAAIRRFQPLWIIREYENKQPLRDSVLLEDANGRRLRLLAPPSLQMAKRIGRE